MRNLRICMLLLLAFGIATHVLAVDYTWNLDANDGDWANSANWWDGSAYGTGVPSGAGDTATIVATVAGPPTNNIPASLTLGSLTVSTNWNSASLATFTGNLVVDTSSSLTTGTNLAITGSLTINTAGSAVILGGTLSVSANLTVNNGSFTSSNFAVTISGNFVNNAGVGGFVLGSSTLTFDGTGNQTLTMGGSTAASADFVINKSAGTMTCSDSLTASSVSITNSGGVSFSNTLTTGAVTLTNTTGTIAFNGNVSITTGLSTAANGYNISFNAGAGGQTASIAGTTTFNNTGTLALGNNAADSITFTGGVIAAAPSVVNIAGTIATGGGAGEDMNLGDGDTGVVLAATTTLDTGSGDITLGGTVSGAFALTLTAGGGTITLASTNGTPTGLTVTASVFSTSGSVTVSAGSSITVTAGQISLGNTFGNSGAGSITLLPSADGTTIGLHDPLGTFNLTAAELGFLTTTGTVTIGRTTGTGAITVAGSGPVNLAGTTYNLLIEGNSSAVSFAANTLTLGNNRTLTFSNGGNIAVVSGATHVSIGGTGALVVSQAGNIGAAGAALETNVSTLRASVTGDIYISEVNAVQLGDGGGITTSGGQIEITAGGALTFGNTVTTTGAGTSISLTATAGGMVISQNIQAANNAQISLTAGGAGSITRPAAGTIGAAGSSTLLVLSAAGSLGASGAALATNVGTIQAGAGGDIYISEASDLQLGDASGPVTTTNGVINITAAGNMSTGIWAGGDIVSTTGGAGGITLTTTAGGTMGISDTIVSAEGGLITLTNAGALTMSADTTARGGLTQNGAGTIVMGCTITTTGDAVNFQRALSMTSACVIDTTNSGGNPAGNNITFQNALSGAETLTLYGGTGGTVTFTGAVGAPNLTGLTIVSALSSIFSSTANFAGPVSISSNEINLNGGAGSFSGNNTLIFAPLSAGQAIAIGGAADTGAATLDLTAADIAALFDGFTSIAVGSATGTGAVTVSGAVTFRDPVTIQSPNGAGAITVSAQITGLGNASVTLNAGTGALNLGASIVTAGNPITLEDNATVTANISLDTTNAGAVPAGALITLNGTIDGNIADTRQLTLRCGQQTLSVANAIGSTNRFSVLTIRADDVTFAASVRAQTINLYTGTPATRSMLIGDAAGGSFSLSDAELALLTGFTTLTVGENGQQAASVTLRTVLSPVPAAALFVYANSGAGVIALDDAGTSIALATGGAGTITLAAGTGGIVASTATNAFAELSTSGTIGLTSAGSIGSGTNRIQFVAGQTNVTVANAPNGVWFDGLGALTLGPITTNSTGASGLDVSTAGLLTLSGAVSTSVGNITFNPSANGVTANSTINGNALTITNGGAVDLNNTITCPNGFSSAGTSFDNTGATITTTNNAIVINHSAAVTIGAALSSGSGQVNIDATGSTINVGASISVSTGAVTLDAAGLTTITAAGTITATGAAPVSFGATLAGTVATAGNVTTAGGAIRYYRDVQLTGNVVISAGNGNCTFDLTINADNAANNRTLTVNTTGTTTFGSTVGDTQALLSLTTNAGGLTVLTGNVTTSGTQSFGDNVQLNANVVLASTTNVGITLAGTVNADNAANNRTLAVNTTGTTTFGSTVGDTQALLSLTTNAGGLTVLTGNVTTSGTQSFGDNVQLNANVVLASTTNLGINLAGTVNADNAANNRTLTVNTTGTTTFGSTVGDTQALLSLTTNAGGLTVLTGNVTTSGILSFGDNVQLNANIVLASTTNVGITLAGTVNADNTANNRTLTVNTTGTTTFGSALGDTQALLSLTTNAGGLTVLTGNVTTSGTQSFGDNVQLNANVVLASTTNVGITLAGTVNADNAANNRTLTVNTTGTTTFGSALGDTQALLSLTTNAGGLTVLTGNVTTSGTQSFGDNVQLNANVVLASTTNLGITLAGTVNADNAANNRTLTVNTTGTTTFGSTVGDTQALLSLSTNAGGLTVLTGNVTTSGTQSFGDNVQLNANVVLASTTNLGITLAGTVNADNTANNRTLTVNTTGTTTFGSTVGDTQALLSLTTNAGGLTVLTGNVTTSGTQSFGDNVQLNANVVLASTTNVGITLAGTVNADNAANNRTLTVNTTGTTTFGSTVGDTQALLSLTTNAGGLTVLTGNVTTSGTQSFGDNVQLNANVVLASTTNVGITLAGTVNADNAANNRTLTVNTTGTTTFGSTVGDTQVLLSLTTNAGGLTVLTGNVTTSGTQSFGDNVQLNANVVLASTTNVGITLAGTVNADNTANNRTLTVNTTGTTTFGSTVGDTQALLSLTTNAGGLTVLTGNVTTSGIQSFGDNVQLNANVVLASTTNAGITLAGTVNADNAANNRTLTVNTTGTTTFGNRIGNTQSLGSITTDLGGQTIVNGISITTSGNQTYNDAIVLGVSSTFTTSGGTIAIGSSVEPTSASTESLTLTAGAGNITITGPVGFVLRLGALSITSANNVTITNSVTATSFNQNAGTGLTSINGAQDYTGSFTFNGTALNINNTMNVGTTITATATGIISITNAGIVSTGIQTWTAVAQGVRITGGGTWQAGGAGISLPNTDVFLDHNGATLVLSANLSCRNLYLYRGNLNIAGRTITTSANAALWGAAYNPDDTEWSGPDTRHAYFPTSSLIYYPANGTYNAGTGLFSIAPNAAFAAGGLAGTTLTIGGNFYDNGVSMNQGACTLNIPANANSNPLYNMTNAVTANQWGTPYAVAFNMTAQNVTAAGGFVAASTTGQGIVNGGGNGNWQFNRPAISWAATVYDDVIRIEFNVLLENSNNEIASALVGSLLRAGINNLTYTITGTYTDAGCTVSTTGAGDLQYFFIRASGRWNTDATGLSSGAGTSTDRSNIIRNSTADIAILKGMLYAADGKTMAQNYNFNGNPAYTGTIDRCRPVLVGVSIGQAAHSLASYHNYDGHNYIQLKYSEPVNIGASVGFTIADSSAQNAKSQNSFSALGEYGGFISGAGSLTVTGYGTVNGTVSLRSRDAGNAADYEVNGLYRAGPNAHGTHGLYISVAGWSFGMNPDLYWPGYFNTATTAPSGTFSSVYNNFITDNQGNPLEPSTDSNGGSVGIAGASGGVNYFNNYAKAVVTIAGTWDTTAPEIVHNILQDDYDIVPFVYTGGETRIEAFEIRIDDVVPGNGIRDTSFTYPTTGTIPISPSAFMFRAEGASFGYRYGGNAFSTWVQAPYFGNTNVKDDQFFTIINDTLENDWRNTSQFYFTYSSAVGLITDWAGNLLPDYTTAPAEKACIEKIPPRIRLTSAIEGDTKIYLAFTEPVLQGPFPGTTTLAPTDFVVSGTDAFSITSITVLNLLGGGVTDVYINVNRAITTSDMLYLQLRLENTLIDLRDNQADISTRRAVDIGMGVINVVAASDGIHAEVPSSDASLTVSQLGTLRVFDGSGRLYDRDITIFAALDITHTPSYGDAAIAAVPLTMYFDGAYPADSSLVFSIAGRNAELAYWLPVFKPGYNRVGNIDARPLAPILAAPLPSTNRNFLIPSVDADMISGATVGFLFRFGDLFLARESIPGDPRSFALWEIRIQDVVKQKGGVTILNNVINSLKRERTTVQLDLAEGGQVTVIVFTLDGDVVTTLHRGRLGAGTYNFVWDGTNMAGLPVARGIYFIRVVGPGIDEIRKVIVIKE